MLKQPMIEKLLAMRLHGMAESLKTQEFPGTPGPVGGSAVELAREPGPRAAAEERQAPHQCLCVEDIDYRGARGLDKSVIRALVQESAWVGTHENVFVLGPTGVGKSFVACALAQKACRDGYSALYTRAQSLFRDLAMARADGSLRSLLARLSRIDVLVIDDWAMSSLSEPERRDFWEICEDRHQVRSTILTAQLRSRVGMNRSAIPLWPTASSTGWSTMPTESRCAVILCVRIAGSRTRSTVAQAGEHGLDCFRWTEAVAPQIKSACRRLGG